MIRARDLGVVAGLLLWWSLALVLMKIRASSHLGRPFRIRRVHQLLDEGRVDEADRIILALQRDCDAAERWREVDRS